MFRIIVCLLMSISVTVNAQNTSEAKLYGQGVHAYNNGEFDAALRIFNVAVEEGTDDPRVFLFRGLVLYHQGKAEESLKDLRHGAELEAVDKRGFYPVSPALTRVQGKVRLQIENLRKEARANLLKIEKLREAARYEEQKANEAVALRKPMPSQAPAVPLDAQQSIKPENPFAPGNIAGVKSNPSNVTVSKTSPKPSVDDRDPLANLNNDNPMPANPVGNSNPPANNTPPAGNNPFAPANNTPPANNNPPAGNNPFAPANNTPPANNNPPAGNNPFAPANNTPPANNNPPAGNNPFAPGNKPPAANNNPPAGNPIPAGDAKKGGTLGAIFGSLNPFSGGNAEPAANAVPGNAKPPTSLEEIKKFIQGSLPGGGLPNVPGGQPAPGGNQPAPGGNNPFGPVPNPFK